MRKLLVILLAAVIGVSLLSGTVVAQTPSINVSSQASPGDYVEIDSVDIDQQGWVAVYTIVGADSDDPKDREREPNTDDLLGAEVVEPDQDGSFTVTLDPALEEPENSSNNHFHLMAVLYYDESDNGDLEFDQNSASQVMTDDEPVQEYFVASVGSSDSAEQFASLKYTEQLKRWEQQEVNETRENLTEEQKRLEEERKRLQRELNNSSDDGGQPLPGFTFIAAILALTAVTGIALRRKQ